jgi:hypothetical protein
MRSTHLEDAVDAVEHLILSDSSPLLEQLRQISSRRNDFSGRYFDPYLESTFTDEVVHLALATCHKELFLRLTLMNLGGFLEELKRFLQVHGASMRTALRNWMDGTSYLRLIPPESVVDQLAITLFQNNFKIASTILEQSFLHLPDQPNETTPSAKEDLARSVVPRIQIVEFSKELLLHLKNRPVDILSLDPDQFERLICDRLHAMGMWVRRVGSVYSPDGGIDIIAGPEKQPTFPFLLVVQTKHHRDKARKTGPGPVRELQGVIQKHPFQAGLLVTNTSFTANAQWEARHRPHLVRLRDSEDLKRWILGDFLHEAEWREIPEFIEYAPGKRIWIPKPVV